MSVPDKYGRRSVPGGVLHPDGNLEHRMLTEIEVPKPEPLLERPPLRSATPEDVVRRLQDSEYPMVAEEALDWGMGSAQYEIHNAVLEAERGGLVIVQELRGKRMLMLHPTLVKPQKFTVTYVSSRGPVQRYVHRTAMWSLKQQIENNARTAEPWINIRIINPEGADVTAEYLEN